MKIGILIPVTSRNRNWVSIRESYLYNYTLKSFSVIYNPEYTYVFYLGIDRNDKIFDNIKNQELLQLLVKQLTNCSLEFHYTDNIEKGYLSKMWNHLFQIAYNNDCDYFFQCGDDIIFKNKNTFKYCIDILVDNNNIGVTGPYNENARILTQTFVSRKHMEIFNCYFSEELINWCIDDWINYVYKPNYFYPLMKCICTNEGGMPRYIINNNRHFKPQDWKVLHKKMLSIVNNDKKKLYNYLQQTK